MLSEIERPLRRAFRLRARLERVGVRLQSTQGISHILARENDRGAILCGRLIEGGVRGVFLVQQGARIEQCLG